MELNLKSIELRLSKLRDYLEVLKAFQGMPKKEFINVPSNHYTAERCLQLAIECCIDIGGHIIAAFGLKRPEEFRDIFIVLRDEDYMEKSFAEAMAQMTSFRNRLVHVYWDTDLNKVYEIVQNNLDDLDKFERWTVALVAKHSKEKQ